MHVVLATDGSRQSLAAAHHLISFADPARISDVTVVGVVSPYASVGFADEISPDADKPVSRSFTDAAAAAVATVAKEFVEWGPQVHERVCSGSPASEIVKSAKELAAGLLVVASGSRGLSDTILLGSTAQRVQHSAPCPVLVVRPAPRPRRAARSRG